MPSRALSANELMEHGTRGTTVQHNTVRDQSCAQQVCVCISVLLRHLRYLRSSSCLTCCWPPTWCCVRGMSVGPSSGLAGAR